MHTTRLAIAVGIALLVATTGARAADPCVGEAKEELADCKGDCKEGYQLAKDDCFNRDHACMEGCRAGREECRIASGIDAALDACRDTLRGAKATCRATKPPDSTELDNCIDQAQVVAFLCRKTAWKAAKPALSACRAGFRACAQACPPPASPSDVVDKVQCKIDARNAYLLCKADCREAFQAQKDLCLHRDHDCVEGCRAERDACRQPVEDQLDADIALCNAGRDADVQNCKNLFGEGTQARADCITQALVDAFQCRDQAREDAKPGFQTCRDDFQTCAEGCPAVP